MERVYASGSMLAGGFIFGLIVGSISEVVHKGDPWEAKRSKTIKLAHAYLHERQVPGGLIRRIRAQLTVSYSQHGTIEQEWDYFAPLPTDLREELGFHLGYIALGSHIEDSRVSRNLLFKVPFCEGLGHTDLIRISNRLKYIRQQPPVRPSLRSSNPPISFQLVLL